ncbi:MAG: hypothetical protein SF187_17730 [Deltaproteobacteria bacterium]|nr:hypothetical protein [Deltaproteobacteria bacterium]
MGPDAALVKSGILASVLNLEKAYESLHADAMTALAAELMYPKRLLGKLQRNGYTKCTAVRLSRTAKAAAARQAPPKHAQL